MLPQVTPPDTAARTTRKPLGQALVPLGALHPPVTLDQPVGHVGRRTQMTPGGKRDALVGLAVGLAVGERERELERLALIQPMGHLVVPRLPWHPPRTLVKFLGHLRVLRAHTKPETVPA